MPDLLRRDFTAAAPNQRYVGDITCRSPTAPTCRSWTASLDRFLQGSVEMGLGQDVVSDLRAGRVELAQSPGPTCPMSSGSDVFSKPLPARPLACARLPNGPRD